MEMESKMLLDAMTQKLKRCGAPHFSQAAQERRKTERRQSREDENFWSSEMARNRESVCDHRRNPEPQACSEHSSHQETFERKERRGRELRAESIRSGRPAVCRCHRDSPGQQMKGGPRRCGWAWSEGWVRAPLSLREARIAS